MIDITTSLEIEVNCMECGEELTVYEEKLKNDVIKIKVSACSRCGEKRYNDGYSDGEVSKSD